MKLWLLFVLVLLLPDMAWRLLSVNNNTPWTKMVVLAEFFLLGKFLIDVTYMDLQTPSPKYPCFLVFNRVYRLEIESVMLCIFDPAL